MLWNLGLRLERLVDFDHLFNPLLPFWVLHGHNLVVGPVKVVGQVGYLLPQPRNGVADGSPT